MTISAALSEAYASGDEDGVVITTAELDHESFEGPVRVVTGIDGVDVEDEILLPIEEGGPQVPHKPCAFAFTRPGADRDGPTEGKVQIDNVSADLDPYLTDAMGWNRPLRLTVRQYRILPGQIDAVTGPDEEIEGLEIKSITLTADTAEGTVGWPDGRTLNVPTGPNAFFDRDEYPALFG